MSPADTSLETICPHCGTQVTAGDTVCWICQRQLPASASVAEHQPTKLTDVPPVANTAWTFNISSLLLVITLIAVCLGVFQIAPGLGVAAAVVSTPALIRTMIYSKRWRTKGDSLSVGEKLLAFAGSVGVVLAICIGACAAFTTVCFGTAAVVCLTEGIDGDRAQLGFMFAMGAGVVLGLGTGGLLAWKLWPRLR